MIVPDLVALQAIHATRRDCKELVIVLALCLGCLGLTKLMAKLQSGDF